MRIPSRPSFLMMIMILAAILLGGLSGYSVGKMAGYTGKYYVVYVDYYLEAERRYGIVPVYPGSGVHSAEYFERAVFVKKAWVEVRDQPPESHVAESRKIRCCYWINGHLIGEERIIAFESTRVEKSFILCLTILVALVFLIILPFRAVAEPELLEVTYVPKHLQEELEKLVGSSDLKD